MYLLYLTVCYLINIEHTTNSYILFAADIEDLRSIAKKFLPDSMASDVFEKYKISDEFHEEMPVAALREEQEPVARHKNSLRQPKRFAHSKPHAAKYDLNLDDLVETVKQRLFEELLQLANREGDATINQVHQTTQKDESTMDRQVLLTDKPHTVKISRYDSEKKHQEKDRNVGFQNSVRQQIQDGGPDWKEASLSTYNQAIQEYLQSKHAPEILKKQRIVMQDKRKVKIPKKTTDSVTTETVPEDIGKLFQGIDMVKEKDSYEDYAIPEKDKSDEIEPTKHYKISNLVTPVQNYKIDYREALGLLANLSNTVHYNIFDTEIEKHDSKPYSMKKKIERMRETYTSNVNKSIKRESVAREPLKLAAILQLLKESTKKQPEDDQLGKPTDVEDKTEIIKADDVKARTESILFEENDGATPLFEEVTVNIIKNKYGKKTKKPQYAGTVIPKKDVSRMSTPNYLGKLPIVVETYKFDEPIPEIDREPDNLMPVKSPQSSINGKIFSS